VCQRGLTSMPKLDFYRQNIREYESTVKSERLENFDTWGSSLFIGM